MGADLSAAGAAAPGSGQENPQRRDGGPLETAAVAPALSPVAPRGLPVPPAPRAPADDTMAESLAVLDRAVRARLARATLGISPYALASAWNDWWFHLMQAPGKQIALALRVGEYVQKLAAFAARAGAGETLPPAGKDIVDPRFAAEEWRRWPFNVIAESFLLAQAWWEEATTNVRGMSRQHRRLVPFLVRQQLDAMAPSNSPWLNPEILGRTLAEHGANLVRGWTYFADDLRRSLANEPPPGAERSSSAEIWPQRRAAWSSAIICSS